MIIISDKESDEISKELNNSLQINNTYLDIYQHQVAGHTTYFMLTLMNTFVMKPCIKLDLFERENNFYQRLYHNMNNFNPMRSYIPKYFGSISNLMATKFLNLKPNKTIDDCKIKMKYSNLQLNYIILEDLTYKYKVPNIIDIKIGQQSFEPDATEIKIQSELEKYKYQQMIGIYMSIYNSIDHYFINNYYVFSIDYIVYINLIQISISHYYHDICISRISYNRFKNI